MRLEDERSTAHRCGEPDQQPAGNVATDAAYPDGPVATHRRAADSADATNCAAGRQYAHLSNGNIQRSPTEGVTGQVRRDRGPSLRRERGHEGTIVIPTTPKGERSRLSSQGLTVLF